MSDKLPTISNIDREALKRTSTSSHGDLNLFVQVGSEKWVLPQQYRKEAGKLLNFEVRPDDIWIVGMPRSGTTMTEGMAWLMVNGVDVERFRNARPMENVQLFESFAHREELPEDAPMRLRVVDEAYKVSEDLLFSNSKIKGRRIIKTHLPFCLLPEEVLNGKCKVIYIARTPQDVIVSSYHLYMNFSLYMGKLVNNFEDFFNLYINDLMIYTPYWPHIKQAWEKRHLPNFKFVFYEDIVRDIRGAIKELSEFLEVELTAEEKEKLEGVMAFDEFKTLRAIKSENDERDFVRKGKIGGFKDYMSEEMMERAKTWVQENSMRIGIEYPCLELKY